MNTNPVPISQIQHHHQWCLSMSLCVTLGHGDPR